MICIVSSLHQALQAILSWVQKHVCAGTCKYSTTLYKGLEHLWLCRFIIIPEKKARASLSSPSPPHLPQLSYSRDLTLSMPAVHNLLYTLCS